MRTWRWRYDRSVSLRFHIFLRWFCGDILRDTCRYYSNSSPYVTFTVNFKVDSNIQRPFRCWTWDLAQCTVVREWKWELWSHWLLFWERVADSYGRWSRKPAWVGIVVGVACVRMIRCREPRWVVVQGWWWWFEDPWLIQGRPRSCVVVCKA
jgi:hypothetical protein